MKKMIKAYSDNAIGEKLIITDEAYHAGYDMKIDSDVNVTIKSYENKKYMPEITVETVEEDGVYYFVPKLKFPELDQNDMEYYDSIHYWLGKWEGVGKFISALVTAHYDPTEWEDEEE